MASATNTIRITNYETLVESIEAYRLRYFQKPNSDRSSGKILGYDLWVYLMDAESISDDPQFYRDNVHMHMIVTIDDVGKASITAILPKWKQQNEPGYRRINLLDVGPDQWENMLRENAETSPYFPVLNDVLDNLAAVIEEHKAV